MLKQKFIGIALVALMTGCSSAPTPTNAKLPLVSVSQNFDNNAVITLAYTDIREGMEIPVRGYKLRVGSAYLSALGKQCFRASDAQASALQSSQHAICKSMAGWQYSGPIVHSAQNAAK